MSSKEMLFLPPSLSTGTRRVILCTASELFLCTLQAISSAIGLRVQPLSQQKVAEAAKLFLKQAAECLARLGTEVAAESCR